MDAAHWSSTSRALQDTYTEVPQTGEALLLLFWHALVVIAVAIHGSESLTQEL